VAHPECGHQIFKHGARPGKQNKGPEGACVLATELEPALLWQLVARNGKEGCDAGFRRIMS